MFILFQVKNYVLVLVKYNNPDRYCLSQSVLF